MKPHRRLIALLVVAGCSDVALEPLEPNITDGQTGVAPISPILVPVDPATPASAVTDEAVTLTNEGGFELAGSASLDQNTMILRFQPIRPMSFGETYTFVGDGIRDSDGGAISFDFTILDFENTTSITFIIGTNEPERYTRSDDSGSVSFDGPGPDGIWLNDDDDVSSYTVEGERVGDTRRDLSFGSGPDGVFFNSDDTPASYRDRFFEGSLEVRRDDLRVGPDGLVGTGDDTITRVLTISHNPDGQSRQFAFFFVGDDGSFGTADDQLLAVFAFVYDERGLSQRTTRVDPGPDGELLTADDVIPDEPPTNLYDERGVSIGFSSETQRSITYVDSRGVFLRDDFFDAGIDRRIDTPDDRITFQTLFGPTQ